MQSKMFDGDEIWLIKTNATKYRGLPRGGPIEAIETKTKNDKHKMRAPSIDSNTSDIAGARRSINWQSTKQNKFWIFFFSLHERTENESKLIVKGVVFSCGKRKFQCVIRFWFVSWVFFFDTCAIHKHTCSLMNETKEEMKKIFF